jgi:CubicO group peptidase (beta-lactamase class C family)
MNKLIKDRIDKVINGLLPNSPISKKYSSPSTLEERMEYYQTPGVSIAVINNYQIEWVKGFGVKEWKKNEPITSDTLFQAASISKPIFALAVMRLVQEGKIDLDEDVNNYLTSWKIPDINEWQPKITMRQLLSHSAGLTVSGFPGYLPTEEIPSLIQILNGEKPSNTGAVRVNIMPGMHFRYSGGGTTVAQLVIENILKKPFPTIMRELILNPFGMEQSTFGLHLPLDWQEHTAVGHSIKYQPLKHKWHIYPEQAAAGLWTNPKQLASLGIQLQKILMNNTEHVIHSSTLLEMLTPQTDSQMGIGFFLNENGHSMRFSHSGWNEGFVSQMSFYKEGGKGAVIMLNSNEAPLLSEIERAIAAEYNWPDYFNKKAEWIDLKDSDKDNVIGSYRSENNHTANIYAIDEKIYFTYVNHFPIQILPETLEKWSLSGLNTTLMLEKNTDGRVISFSIHQEGKNINFIKE